MMTFSFLSEYPVLIALFSFLLTLIFTPLVIRLAIAKDWVAYPRKDRWNAKPVALAGGMAIFASFIPTILFLPRSDFPFILLGGITLLFVMGLMDDLFELKPAMKILFQIAGAVVLVSGGYVYLPGLPLFVSVPLTFLWVIGISNALNLLDNMDGITAGISGIILTGIGLLAWLNGSGTIALLSFGIAGASFGFLIFNFSPAKVFMGDSGSMFLGFSIAALVIALQHESPGESSKVLSPSTLEQFLFSAALLAIPIFDTTLVTIRRILSGRSPKVGGRDHSTHRLVALGLSESHTAYLLYLLSALFIVPPVIAEATGSGVILVILPLLGAGLALFGLYLMEVHVYDEKTENFASVRSQGQYTGDPAILRFLLRHKKLMLGFLVDSYVFFSSFILAVWIYDSERLSLAFIMRNIQYILLLAIVKTAALYVADVYKHTWRYVGSSFFVKVFGVLLLTTCFTYGVVRYGGLSIPGLLILIDAFVSFFCISALRLIAKHLPMLIASGRNVGSRVALYGAGGGGMRMLEELLLNASLNLIPVGFLDDAPHKKGHIVHSYPVFGSINEVMDIIDTYRIEKIVITSKKIEEEKIAKLREICKSKKIAIDESLNLIPPRVIYTSDSKIHARA